MCNCQFVAYTKEAEMIWRDIPGYEGLYQVSDTGLVKSLAREHAHLPDVQERQQGAV